MASLLLESAERYRGVALRYHDGLRWVDVPIRLSASADDNSQKG